MKNQVLIAAVLGLFAMLFAGLYLVSVESAYRAGSQKVKVLVSKEYINQGKMIDETMVQETLVPKEYVQPKALQSLKDLRSTEGKMLFLAVAPVEQGEQVVTTKLSMLGRETGISAVIPTAQRAITIPMDSKLISGIIKPGNRIDVIGIFDYQDKSGEQQQVAVTFLQDILVISVGNTILGGTSKKTSDVKGILAQEESLDSVPVSFSLSPQEGEMLSLASEKGIIKLASRPAGDESLFQTKGTKMKDLYGDITITGNAPTNPQSSRDLQAKQKEIIQILKKYQK